MAEARPLPYRGPADPSEAGRHSSPSPRAAAGADRAPAAGSVYPVLAASLSRTFADLVVFGYVPLQLYVSGERSLLRLGLVTALPALVRFVAANVWGAVCDATGRFRPVLVAGILGYVAACVGLLGVTTGLQAMAVTTAASVLYSALSPAGKALVSLNPGRAGTPGRALAWWLQLESWGWAFGSAAVAVRERLGAPPDSLLVVAAVLLVASAGWVAWGAPQGACTWRPTPAPCGSAAPGPPARGRVGERVRARFAELAREWQRLYSHRALALVLAAFGLAVLAGEASFTVFGFYLVGTLGGSQALYGATLTLATALGLVAYAFLGGPGHRISPGNLMLAGGLLYVAMYLVMAGAPTAMVAAAAFSLPLYALARAGATWAAGSLTKPSERGGGMGALDGVEALAVTLGALAGGVIGDAWGLRAVYAACAGVAAVMSLVAWRLRMLLQHQPQGHPV